MDNEIELSGMDELLKKLEYMVAPTQQNATIKKALNAGAEIIKFKVRPKLPVSKESKEHAADHIEISGIKRKNGIPYVTVGPDPGDDNKYFYLKFYEWGTTKPNALGKTIPAQAMFGRTLAEEKEAIKLAMAEELKKGLGI